MKKKVSVFLIVCLMISQFCFFSSAKEKKEKETGGGINVKAKAAVLMDASTGDVLYSMNENEQLYPASVTKIMPLLLFMEALDSGKMSLTDTVTCSPEASAKGGSQIWLKEGESMSVDDLLKAVAIGSANDACCALGEFIAGSESAFVDMMNNRAKELGMENTHFDNCTGLDDETDTHKTTAYDIALMSRELLRHETIQKYSTVWMDSLRDGATELVNTNKLVRFYNGTTGLKTGTTSKAGKCLSASAKRDSLHLIAVVLGSETSDDRFESAKALLNYGFANYENTELTFDESLITPVQVIRGVEESIMPEYDRINNVTIKKGDKANIASEITLCTDVEAPVEEGQVLGEIVFTLNGEKIASTNLFAGREIKRLTFSDVFKMLIQSLASKK